MYIWLCAYSAVRSDGSIAYAPFISVAQNKEAIIGKGYLLAKENNPDAISYHVCNPAILSYDTIKYFAELYKVI